MLIMHNQQLGSLPFFFFRPRDMTYMKIRKNTKVGITFDEGKKKRQACRLCAHVVPRRR